MDETKTVFATPVFMAGLMVLWLFLYICVEARFFLKKHLLFCRKPKF